MRSQRLLLLQRRTWARPLVRCEGRNCRLARPQLSVARKRLPRCSGVPMHLSKSATFRQHGCCWRAAESGDPRAALALGATYDPIALAKRGVQGLVADVTAARTWYDRAKQLGSEEARAGLTSWPASAADCNGQTSSTPVLETQWHVLHLEISATLGFLRAAKMGSHSIGFKRHIAQSLWRARRSTLSPNARLSILLRARSSQQSSRSYSSLSPRIASRRSATCAMAQFNPLSGFVHCAQLKVTESCNAPRETTQGTAPLP